MDMAGNQSRDYAGASDYPDVMNDPAYDEREKGPEEMDTCRICHGEATEEEPLFYPCKCSGSIKFVHQMCLVEWLSHSQKKHCELCKTPFRFTKLYDPNMPQSLPAPLFLRQALIQTFRTLMTWLRFVLVAFVWLGWLPWSMRAIWRALFWLADGRWSAPRSAQGQAVQTTQDGLVQLIASASTSSDAAARATTSTIATAAGPYASDIPSMHTSMLSYPADEPIMFTLVKKVISALFIPAITVGQGSSTASNASTGTRKLRYPSWLSDVKFLNSLTPYSTINNMIIDTLEGQLITLLVVVAFILLFLIREWVVQQQPMANIADGEREAAVQLIANNRPNEGQAARPEPDPQHAEHPVRQDQGAQAPEVDEDRPPRAAAQSPAPSWTDSDDDLSVFEGPAERTRDTLAGIPFPDSVQQQGHAPNPILGVTAIREISDRANGDRDEIFRILREEGREEELGWLADTVTATPMSRLAQTSLNDEFPELAAPAARESRTINGDIPESSGALGPFVAEPENGNLDSTQRNDTNQAPVPDETASANRQVEASQPAKGVTEQLFDWFWGDIAPLEDDADEPLLAADDEHIVQDPALEDPFVPLQNREQDAQADAGMAAGADDAGLDANDMDAIEGDDFEGIMDLIGMQGPIFGLLQNGVFCALLIAFTVTLGIWLPYLWGKIALVLLANPVELIVGVPMTALTVVADIILDTLVGSLGYVMYWLSLIFKVFLSPFSSFIPFGEWIPRGKSVTSASLSLIDASTNRLNKAIKAFLVFHESDIPMFSVLSHQALKLHQARLILFAESAFAAVKFILHDLPLRIVTHGIRDALWFDFDLSQLRQLTAHLHQQLTSVTKSPLFSSPGSTLAYTSSAKAASTPIPVDYDLAVWDTKDRIIAILMGYLLATILGLLYLRIAGLLSGTNRGQRIDGVFAEILLQAGGVMKVILIIGIEMIVFPLYCGTLLDVALLPLFADATIASRVAFTAASPLTSLFVHWFIGTCYMFHFALFVSMCRKILRSGVLYFIRDPDDPTFHPIRDVLERSITTQLRKIGFSALVYGALVIICLGGVVWGLHFALDGVLPIHWSANAPMLEFPIDLLFYNFVMPLAIQSVKPSDGLHELYDWWFHQCAHFLRLSNFFFPERHPEEEGYHVRRTWWGVLTGSQGDWKNPIIGDDQHAAAENENRDVYFVRDGKYVRAPASDQVRIPKGSPVFLEVTENNERADRKPDPEDGLHGRASNMFTKVYIPPWFQTRIAAFILLIWLFAATTGVGVTIVPLIIGRKLIASLVSSPVPVNDIYAFSCGLCVVGGFAYVVYHCRTALRLVRDHSQAYLRDPRQAGQAITTLATHTARLLYMSAALIILLPFLFALLTELYILIPAHTFFGDGQTHVVHVVQDWTLGVLYVQMAIKLTLWHPHSWAAAALNGIFRDGWSKPNVNLATRAVILPVSLFTVMAVALPLTFGFVLRWTVFHPSTVPPADVYRYTYPATLLLGLATWTMHLVRRQLNIWRIHIRDDVYLIGERLHNFSEKRARDVGVSRRVITG